MKLQTVVTVNEVVEVDIELPYYCKDAEGQYYALEDKSITVVKNRIGWLSLIVCGTPSVYHRDIAKATAITKEAFEAAKQEALNFIDQHSKQLKSVA